MSEEDAGMHRGGASRAAPGSGSLPDVEDLLREVLVRLPPDPSSLPRASAVCKRWRRLVTDPKFLRLFCAHHRKPPLLGVFEFPGSNIFFSPILDPPNRIPRGRFSLSGYVDVLDVRHGRVLVKDAGGELVVCDPITGQRRRVAIPPEIKRGHVNGAVLCAAAAGDQGHVHGGCHSSPFKVVLVSMYGDDSRSIACVYSSETDMWSNLISTEAPYELRGDAGRQPTLVGNTLYWLSMSDGILEFDLDEQSLAVIEGPPVTNDFRIDNRKIIRAEDGAVGFIIVSYPHFHLWQRNINDHGVATWVPWKTMEFGSILGRRPQIAGLLGERLLGYDENADVLFLHVGFSVFMLQLKSMQLRKLCEIHYTKNRYFPFSSFYAPGTAVAGGFNGADMLNIG